MKGWVYIIINDAMPDLIKIGYSSKDPYERAKELSHTGSPLPYRVVYEVLVNNPYLIEQNAHQILHAKRVGKEWFRCAIHDGISVINSIVGDNALYRGSASVSIKVEQDVDSDLSAYSKFGIDESRLLHKLVSLHGFYGDVPSTINCFNPRSNAEKIICSNCALKAMELLDSMAYVYFEENATKSEVDHVKFRASGWIMDVRNKCNTIKCLCDVFKEHTNNSLGGMSPYYPLENLEYPHMYMQDDNQSLLVKVNKRKILRAIVDLHNEYGNVPSTIKFWSLISKAEKIISSSNLLSAMELLDSMAYVFSIEKNTYIKVNHRECRDDFWIKNIRNKCDDIDSLCMAFVDHTKKSLGKDSPYDDF